MGTVQTVQAPTPLAPAPPTLYQQEVAFDKIYWAAQHPELQALPAISDLSQRIATATQLAMKGFLVDTEIMVYGWDPYLTMVDRAEFGYTWVPSLLQAPPAIAPGVSEPGVTAYDPNSPPPGSIKVSTNPSDYPSLVPPQAPPTPITELVGIPVFGPGVGQTYYTVSGDNSPDGTIFNDSRGTFTKHVTLYGGFRSAVWVMTASGPNVNATGLVAS